MSGGVGTRRRPIAFLDRRGISTIDALAQAARQVSLYGPAHRVAQDALQTACDLLASALVDGRLEIRAQQDGLLWNGDPLEMRNGNVRRFHAAMRERVISRIEFGAKVKPGDLGRLLEVLSEDAEELLLEGGAVRAFGLGADSSIRIDEVDFANELLVSETAWRQLRETMASDDTAGLNEVIASCARSLRASGGEKQPGARPVDDLADETLGQGPADEVVATGLARLIQQAGEAARAAGEKTWRAWREQMADQLAALSPRWRAGVFRAPTGVSSECPDMLAVIAGAMDPADCVSLVLDHPDSIQAERSAGLAVALQRIAATPDRRGEVEALLHEAALSRGVPEEVYQNVVGLLMSAGGGRAAAKTGQIRTEGNEYQPTLGGARNCEESLNDLLQTIDGEAVRRSRLCMLEEVLGANLTARQYGTVISLLVKATDDCAAQGDTAGLFAVLTALEDQARGRLGQEDSRRVVAASALARSSSEVVVSCLLDGFDRSPEERRKSIIGLLGILGEPGARALGEIIATGGETDFAPAVRAVLANDSRGLPHVRDLLSWVNRSRAERMLAVLLEAKGADAPAQVAAAVDDAPEAVRLSLIRMVQKSGRARFATPLIRWVSDAPCTVRLAAMRALGELRVSEAVPALMDIVNLESNFGEGALLKEGAVDALAGIGATSAVPKLCELLEGGLLRSMIGSPRPRVAAARALGELGGPDARHTLEKGSRSAHRGLRRASQRAHARLRAREGTRGGRIGNVR